MTFGCIYLEQRINQVSMAGGRYQERAGSIETFNNIESVMGKLY